MNAIISKTHDPRKAFERACMFMCVNSQELSVSRSVGGDDVECFHKTDAKHSRLQSAYGVLADRGWFV